jgi:hypothetical protein
MLEHTIRFHCSGCLARIKAPVQLCGHQRTCPGCRQTVTVPYPTLDDAEPVLVPVDAQVKLVPASRHALRRSA